METTSASSSNKVNKDEQVDPLDPPKTRWLKAFLKKSFSDSCTSHPLSRNELNTYCINCNLSACRHCVSSGLHNQHKILKIHKHVYTDVVPLCAMEEHMDCSEIQPYRCNKRLVVSLDPLPHSGSAINDEGSCNMCSRKLTEPGVYSYCSISCKVKGVEGKANDSVPSQETQEETSKPLQLEEETAETIPEVTSNPQSLRKRRRKGTPHRAPFF